MLSNKDFYERIAADYDKMTAFGPAITRASEFYIRLGIKQAGNAVDFGCGTGADSIALAGLGYNVTGFDPAPGMISQAKINAERHGMSGKVNFRSDSFPAYKFPAAYKADLITCRGNVLANLDGHNLNAFFRKVKKIIAPEGILILQLINYVPILAEKKRIVSTRITDDKIFVRFYDFEKSRTFFNIMSIDLSEPKNTEILSTRIYPVTKDRILELLAINAFRNIYFYGDVQLQPFNPEKSSDLIVTAAVVSTPLNHRPNATKSNESPAA